MLVLHNICHPQRAGMEWELSGSVLGLMTGAKLLQVGLCYMLQADYLVHRYCTVYTGVKLGTAQVYRQPGPGAGKLSSDLMTGLLRQWTLGTLWPAPCSGL